MKNTEANRGYEMYARVYWAAPPLPDGEFHLMQNEINWEYFVLGIDAVLNKYPTQWNINHFAFFVCMGGDWQKTKELLAKIEEPIVLAAWQGQHNYNFCKRTISLWERRQPKLD
jgi:hypothetical protein